MRYCSPRRLWRVRLWHDRVEIARVAAGVGPVCAGVGCGLCHALLCALGAMEWTSVLVDSFDAPPGGAAREGCKASGDVVRVSY